MQNGNKVTRKNWQKVVAISLTPNTSNFGWPVIDAARANGGYFDKWKLVYEDNKEPERTGYIFREINHNGGINGHHKTPKEAIWWALAPGRLKVYLEENELENIQ